MGSSRHVFFLKKNPDIISPLIPKTVLALVLVFFRHVTRVAFFTISTPYPEHGLGLVGSKMFVLVLSMAEMAYGTWWVVACGCGMPPCTRKVVSGGPSPQSGELGEKPAAACSGLHASAGPSTCMIMRCGARGGVRGGVPRPRRGLGPCLLWNFLLTSNLTIRYNLTIYIYINIKYR